MRERSLASLPSGDTSIVISPFTTHLDRTKTLEFKHFSRDKGGPEGYTDYKHSATLTSC